ncbi:TPA: hypothetical protein ACNE23_004666 [Escherichia coli]
MSSELIAKPGTGVLSTDTTKFEGYLSYLGLPTENIIASLPERQIIEKNLPTFIDSLPAEVKRDARYGNDSNLLIVFYVQIMPDDLVMQLHRF